MSKDLKVHYNIVNTIRVLPPFGVSLLLGFGGHLMAGPV
jgi:hypothetical protein